MDQLNQQPYSYRTTPTVPDFDDTNPIVFMDGECALCSKSAKLLFRLDRKQEFKICPIQSDLGLAILTHYGLDPTSPDSWLYLVDGKAYTSMDAIIRTGWRVGGIGRLAAIMRILPTSWQNNLYSYIAKRRYKIWGKTDICKIPDPNFQKRIIR